jgi:hypothetical protein
MEIVLGLFLSFTYLVPPHLPRLSLVFLSLQPWSGRLSLRVFGLVALLGLDVCVCVCGNEYTPVYFLFFMNEGVRQFDLL